MLSNKVITDILVVNGNRTDKVDLFTLRMYEHEPYGPDYKYGMNIVDIVRQTHPNTIIGKHVAIYENLFT